MNMTNDNLSYPAQELGMPIMPLQQWTSISELRTGLKAGTIFSDLDKPFYMGGVSLAGQNTAAQ